MLSKDIMRPLTDTIKQNSQQRAYRPKTKATSTSNQVHDDENDDAAQPRLMPPTLVGSRVSLPPTQVDSGTGVATNPGGLWRSHDNGIDSK